MKICRILDFLIKPGTIITMILVISLAPYIDIPDNFKSAKAQSVQNLREGNDFATLVLKDPWDMSEFTDISQALNLSGQAHYLSDIKVDKGIFSARSTETRDAQFFALWPGYNTAMLIDKVGHRFPIDANRYHCFYIGMKVQSGAADGNGPDLFQLMWFGDERLNNGTWGYSKAFQLYPEAGAGTPIPTWKLYKVDLASPENRLGGAHWTDGVAWQGLRIDPTNQVGNYFEIDWIRLTDCNPVILKIFWSGSQTVSIWVQPEDSIHSVLILSNVQGNTYDLDVQGIPPGVYSYIVKDANNNVIKTSEFKINKTPIVKFVRPSFISGVDYATQAGNPWDFSDSSDFWRINDMNYSVDDGLLKYKLRGDTGKS